MKVTIYRSDNYSDFANAASFKISSVKILCSLAQPYKNKPNTQYICASGLVTNGRS